MTASAEAYLKCSQLPNFLSESLLCFHLQHSAADLRHRDLLCPDLQFSCISPPGILLSHSTLLPHLSYSSLLAFTAGQDGPSQTFGHAACLRDGGTPASWPIHNISKQYVLLKCPFDAYFVANEKPLPKPSQLLNHDTGAIQTREYPPAIAWPAPLDRGDTLRIDRLRFPAGSMSCQGTTPSLLLRDLLLLPGRPSANSSRGLLSPRATQSLRSTGCPLEASREAELRSLTAKCLEELLLYSGSLIHSFSIRETHEDTNRDRPASIGPTDNSGVLPLLRCRR